MSCVLCLMIEHAENPLIEVHAGVPKIPRPNRSEDEEIERLLRQHMGNRDDDINDNGNNSDDEFMNEEFDQLLQEFVNTDDDELCLDDNIDGNAAEPIQWLTQGEAPINEYNTEGYIAIAFPTLFPYGRADLRDNSRRNTYPKVAEYFEALLRFKDGRFGMHPR